MKSVNYRPDGGLPQAEGGRAGERESGRSRRSRQTPAVSRQSRRSRSEATVLTHSPFVHPSRLPGALTCAIRHSSGHCSFVKALPLSDPATESLSMGSVHLLPTPPPLP
jgi:hypothetical protein